ncbi:MAG: hypothetical protein AAFX99_35415, partial [Myxococcota bacterium]
LSIALEELFQRRREGLVRQADVDGQAYELRRTYAVRQQREAFASTYAQHSTTPNAASLLWCAQVPNADRWLSEIRAARGALDHASLRCLALDHCLAAGRTVHEGFGLAWWARKERLRCAEAETQRQRLTTAALHPQPALRVTQFDCRPLSGIRRSVHREASLLVGRALLEPVVVGGMALQANTIVEAHTIVTPELLHLLEEAGQTEAEVRWLPSCRAPNGVCALCVGQLPNEARLPQVGEDLKPNALQLWAKALSMPVRRPNQDGRIVAPEEVIVHWVDLKGVQRTGWDERAMRFWYGDAREPPWVVLRSGTLCLEHVRSGRMATVAVPHGAQVWAADQTRVAPDTLIAEWSPHARWVAVLPKETRARVHILPQELSLVRKFNVLTGLSTMQVPSYDPAQLSPMILLDGPNTLQAIMLPAGAELHVSEGMDVFPGDTLITWALERAEHFSPEELLQAPRPRNPVLLAPCDGTLRLIHNPTGSVTLMLEPDHGASPCFIAEVSGLTRCEDEERVQRGQWLSYGTPDLAEILRIQGRHAAARISVARFVS